MLRTIPLVETSPEMRKMAEACMPPAKTIAKYRKMLKGSKKKMRKECDHGSLARSCEICDLKAQVASFEKIIGYKDNLIDQACAEGINLRNNLSKCQKERDLYYDAWQHADTLVEVLQTGFDEQCMMSAQYLIEREQARAREAIMREALEWYASRDRVWRRSIGERAREALVKAKTQP